MTKLKTFNIRGHAHFVTIPVFNRVPLFRQSAYAKVLLDNLNFYRNKYKFKLLGYVIMPDHLHCLILPSKRGTISEIMRDLKKYTAI